MKYMVMECHPGYAVVLDEDGHFLKVADLHYKTGQIVTDVIEMQTPQTAERKKRGRKWIYSVAAMAACLVLMVTSMLQMDHMTYASVYIMINPGVRIDVNRRDLVVGLEAANPDGEDLIEDYSYEKKDLELVMDELVDRAVDMGYLHEGGRISLTLDADSDEWVVNHDEALSEHLIEYLKDLMSVTIEVNGEIRQSSVISIPLPEENYGEEDYGENTDSSNVSVPSSSDSPAPSGPSASSGTDSSNSDDDDGQTDYGEQSGSGNTGQNHSGSAAEGQSDYDDQDDDQSEYESSEENDSEYD